MSLTKTTAWEYEVYELPAGRSDDQIRAILNGFGEAGWELVSVLQGPTGEQHVAYLKRPK
jgi:hypothetical protein